MIQYFYECVKHVSCSDYFVMFVHTTAVLYGDLSYGLGLAPWDAMPPSEEALVSLLQGFVYLKRARTLVSVVLWCNPFELALVKRVLKNLSFKHIQVLTWYKSGYNQVSGPACTFLPATEMAIIAFHGEVTAAPRYLNMPLDPLQRHNHVIGPKMGKRAVDNDQEEINPCEKPAYLAEWILRKLTKTGDTVVVAGFGAGGDLRGALNAGCNVLATEQDVRQFNAVKRILPMFKPKSNLSMVILPSMITFGAEWSARLAPYCKNFDEGIYECPGCTKEWPGQGFKCPACKLPCCRDCLPEESEQCKNCAIIAAEFAKSQENQEPKPPALAAESQD